MKRFLFITLLIILSYSLNSSRQAVAGSISAAPVNPSAGQAVTFQYVANVTASVKWNFGDGNSSCNGAEAVFTHTFANPGSYTVRAWDTFCDDGAAPTATKTIVVGAGAPGAVTTPGTVALQAFEIQSGQLLFQDGTTSVTIPKNKTGLRAKVTLQGEGTGRVRLQWLLDGQPFSSQVKMVNFSRQRNVTIQSTRDLPTQIPGSSHTVSLRIQEPRSPKAKIADISYGVDRPAFGASAGFTVSYIELRFKNRSAYMNVDKNHRNFKAYADFKCEGAGTLQVQWLVDGQPFFIQSKSVNFAETVTIDSGRNLPTLVPGSHSVSIRLLSPQTRLKIPVIKYLVGGESTGETSKYNVDIKFNSYQDNFGKINSFSGTTLKAKQGDYLVMNGKVINKSEMAIPKGFMQMYIDGKLMATQAIRLIPPGGLVPFNTSILFPEVQKSQVEFRFTDKIGQPIDTVRLDLLADKGAVFERKIVKHPEMNILKFERDDSHNAAVNELYFYVHFENAKHAIITGKYVPDGKNKQQFKEIEISKERTDYSVGNPIFKERIKIALPKGKDIDFVQELTLHIQGVDRQGKQINKHKTVYYRELDFAHRDYALLPLINPFELKVIKNEKENLLEIAGVEWSRLKFNYKTSTAGKIPPSVSLVHLPSGKSVDPNKTYSEFISSTVKNDAFFLNYVGKNFLPGSGLYELRATNVNGTATKRIHVRLKDFKLQSWINDQVFRGCTDGASEYGKKRQLFLELKGYGNCMTERHAAWGRSKCTEWYNCGAAKNDPEYRKLKELWGEGMSPTITFFRPEEGVSAQSSLEPGTTTKLLVQIADSPNGRIHNKTTVKLFENGSKLISTRTFRKVLPRGKTPVETDPDAMHSGGGHLATWEFEINLHKTTKYLVTADSDNGSTSAITTVYVQKAELPTIDRLDLDQGKETSQAYTARLHYAISNAASARFFSDRTYGKLERIGSIGRMPGEKTTRGSIKTKIEDPSRSQLFRIIVKNSNGDTAKKTIYSGVIQKESAIPFIHEFAARPNLIYAGIETTLKYTVSGYPEKGWLYNKKTEDMLTAVHPGAGNPTGTISVKPTETTTYLLRFTNKNGASQLKETTVTVRGKAIIDFSANPPSIKNGETVQIYYDISNATSAKIMEELSGKQIKEIKILQDYTAQNPLTVKPDQMSTYVLEVKDRNGDIHRKKATVKVNREEKAPQGGKWVDIKPSIQSFDTSKSSLKPGGVLKLNYKFTGANEAYILEKKSGKILATLQVGSPGTYAEGHIIAKIPTATTNDSFSWQLKLKNMTGETTREAKVNMILPLSGKVFAPGSKRVADQLNPDVTGMAVALKSGMSPLGVVSKQTKPVGNLTPDKKTYTAGEQIILSYSVKNAVVAYIDYSLPDGRGKRYDIALQQGAAQGTLKMTASSAGAQSYATIGAGVNVGTIARFSSYSVKKENKKKASYTGKPAVFDFDVTPNINLGEPCYASYEFRFTESAYVVNEQTGKKTSIAIAQPVTLNNPTKGSLTFYPKQNTTYRLVVTNPNGQYSFSEKVIVAGGKSKP